MAKNHIKRFVFGAFSLFVLIFFNACEQRVEDRSVIAKLQRLEILGDSISEDRSTSIFRLDMQKLDDDSLKIIGNEPFNLFVNNTFSSRNDTLIISEEQFKSQGTKSLFTLNADFDLKDLQLVLMKASNIEKRAELRINSKRENRSFIQFINIQFCLFLVFAAWLRISFGKEIFEYFRLSYVFSGRNRDENLFHSKIFSPNTIFIAVINILILSTLFTVYRYQVGWVSDQLGSLFLDWGFWILVNILLYSIKLLLLNLFTRIFAIESFFPFHFYNYLRFNFLWLFLMLLITLLLSWYFFPADFSSLLLRLLIIGYSCRCLLILFRVFNMGGFKFLHLFSYLCATEIFPFFWIIMVSGNFLV